MIDNDRAKAVSKASGIEIKIENNQQIEENYKSVRDTFRA